MNCSEQLFSWGSVVEKEGGSELRGGGDTPSLIQMLICIGFWLNITILWVY